MILAAADCADGKGPPPPDLILAWQARTWNTLPEPGGLRDQYAGELARMSAAMNTYDAWRRRRHHQNWAKWAKDDPKSWHIILHVQKLRQLDGKNKNS